jgi:N-acetylglutamate synthase-like GNAT family acetyltransferase
VSEVIADARKKGVQEVVLPTTTARDFFARRFGFVEAPRADFQDQFADSPEWHFPRCSSATVMKLNLREIKSKKG